MKEVHVAITKVIGGKQVVADVELCPDQMEELPPWEQANILLTAYQAAKSALHDKATDAVCEEIKNLVPRTKRIIKAT